MDERKQQQQNGDAFDQVIDAYVASDPTELMATAREGYRRHGRGLVVVFIQCDAPDGADGDGRAYLAFRSKHIDYLPVSAIPTYFPEIDGARDRALQGVTEYRPAQEMVLATFFMFPEHLRRQVSMVLTKRPFNPVSASA